MFKVIDKKLLSIYFILEMALFIIIKYMEVIRDISFTMCLVKFLTIFFDFVIAVYVFNKYRRGQKYSWDDLIFAGLCFIFLGDVFLTLLALYMPSEFTGFVCFCVVQTIFCIYLKPDKWNILLRILVLALSWGILFNNGLMNVVNSIGILNITLIIVNMLYAWRTYVKTRSKKNLLFALGLSLFVICDVGLLLRRTTVGMINEVIRYIVWSAYIPAIISLTLSYVESIAEKNEK